MRLVILAVLCAVALGQMDFQELVGHEVHALLQADPALTQADCVSKCDDLFPMADDKDEAATDHACNLECERQLNGGTAPPPGTHQPHDPHHPPHNGGDHHHPPAGK